MYEADANVIPPRKDRNTETAKDSSENLKNFKSSKLINISTENVLQQVVYGNNANWNSFIHAFDVISM